MGQRLRDGETEKRVVGAEDSLSSSLSHVVSSSQMAGGVFGAGGDFGVDVGGLWSEGEREGLRERERV